MEQKGGPPRARRPFAPLTLPRGRVPNSLPPRRAQLEERASSLSHAAVQALQDAEEAAEELAQARADCAAARAQLNWRLLEAEAEAGEEERRRLKVTTAKNPARTYLQEFIEGKWKLVVEVSEAMTSRHAIVIGKIHKAMMQRPNMDKQGALAMRKEKVGR